MLKYIEIRDSFGFMCGTPVDVFDVEGGRGEEQACSAVNYIVLV
jgi:hypothetical protein